MKVAKVVVGVTGFCLWAGIAAAQTAQIPARWDELTASDWPAALEKSGGTAILPIGILEKHGPHAPIGSDLIQVREWAARATKQEYAVVFPDYFYGQINEARHEPGAFALPSRLVWDLLDAGAAGDRTADRVDREGAADDQGRHEDARAAEGILRQSAEVSGRVPL